METVSDNIVRFIGDVHGKYTPYKKLIRNGPPSIQVGDMGIGFRRISGPNKGEIYGNPPHYLMKENRAFFIRGNHDNPEECRKHSQWIPDGYFENGFMFLGGTASSDSTLRTKNYNWWEDEELSQQELNELIQKYVELKPHTMVSHDCPSEVADVLNNFELFDKSRTQQALQAMWNGHSPDLWIFGHHHKHCWLDLEKDKKNTKFICLAELEYLDIDLSL